MSLQGLNLFQEGLEMDFIARQRVTENNDQSLSPLFGSVYKQDILSIIGINASGKTTALRWLSFLLDIYLSEGKINDQSHQELIQEQSIIMEAYFSDNEKVYKIQSDILSDESGDPVFAEEKLWEKKFVKSLSRKTLLSFTDTQLVFVRSKENSVFLSDYMSIMISQRKKQMISPKVANQIQDTNINLMRVLGNVPVEVIQFLDDSIEYVSYKGNPKEKLHITLKFKNRHEEINIFDPLELASYLSSGTIKGLNVFAGLQNVLATGGFLIIDEIENHFNEAIVKMIIQMFKNKQINVIGATLIFTTHYASLLDEFDRNDSVYISFKEKTLRLINLANLLKRNDFKKSEIYQSSYVGKTAPHYPAYLDLKKYFLRHGEKIKEKWSNTI